MGEFVDAENKEIARRHADLQRKNQEFSSSPFLNSSPSALDSSQLSCDLWEAANRGRADTTRLLLASGADPNRLKRTGLMSTSTSLVVAACKGHTGVVTALVEHPTTDVNATVSGGWTALMWAAWYGHMKVVEVLLGTPEVEVDKLNQAGKSAVMYAAEAGRLEVSRLLLEGADKVEAGEEDRVVRRSRLDKLLDQAQKAGCDVTLAKMVLATREMAAEMKMTTLQVAS